MATREESKVAGEFIASVKMTQTNQQGYQAFLEKMP
jgi:hypothetical protein